jgi:hypothetical protein
MKRQKILNHSPAAKNSAAIGAFLYISIFVTKFGLLVMWFEKKESGDESGNSRRRWFAPAGVKDESEAVYVTDR